MFEGFERRRIRTRGADIHLVVGGRGPPLLLLHGFPQTHVAWHAVAPLLLRRFTVVAPDLRGYGDSTTDLATSDAANFSKRALAEDQVETMAALGFPRFHVAGHDRGGRVAYRLALDHPQRVDRLAVLDIVPTLAMWRSADKAFGLANWHWFFLAQTGGLPEAMISAAPDLILDAFLARWARFPERLDPTAIAEYRRCFRKPEVIAAACADYRAGATLDAEHDAVDLSAGRRVTQPLLALWNEARFDAGATNPLAIWREWAANVQGEALPCGHFLQEEQPDETAARLIRFFGM
jgi:haloacetate dehalogenase